MNDLTRKLRPPSLLARPLWDGLGGVGPGTYDTWLGNPVRPGGPVAETDSQARSRPVVNEWVPCRTLLHKEENNCMHLSMRMNDRIKWLSVTLQFGWKLSVNISWWTKISHVTAWFNCCSNLLRPAHLQRIDRFHSYPRQNDCKLSNTYTPFNLFPVMNMFSVFMNIFCPLYQESHHDSVSESRLIWKTLSSWNYVDVPGHHRTGILFVLIINFILFFFWYNIVKM